MSERREPSREHKPFDSRREARVTLVTPRNPAPAPPASEPASDDEDSASREEIAPDSR